MNKYLKYAESGVGDYNAFLPAKKLATNIWDFQCERFTKSNRTTSLGGNEHRSENVQNHGTVSCKQIGWEHSEISCREPKKLVKFTETLQCQRETHSKAT